MKRFLLLSLLTFGLAAGMYAQQRVSGTVTDDGGSPLIGATVVEKGTSNGTITDVDGNFSLDVADSDAILQVSYTGYQSQDMVVSGQSVFTVVLSEGVSLDEVVVTGYTVDSRRQTTGAVSTVKTKELTAIPSGNVEQQLQGRVAGLTVITNGQPGTNSIVRVRGFGSFGGNEPLYIVDGVPTTSTDFIPPDDIESTTVLKDAASASIYGARAAGGVIIYTTRHGKKDDNRLGVSYDGLYGFTQPGTAPGSLNPQDFADWTWQAIRNTAAAAGTQPVFNHPQFGSGQNPVIPDYLLVGTNRGVVGNVDLAAEELKYNNDSRRGPIYLVVPANKAGTDWYDEITDNAPMTRHNLGFSGSGERSRYYLGMGAQLIDGILLHNKFERYHFRANTEFDVTDFFRVGENLQFTNRSVLGQDGGNNGQGIAESESDILFAFRMPTIIPVYDAFGGYGGTAVGGFNNPRNPVANRNRVKDNAGYNGHAFGSVYAELDLGKNITLRTNLGGTYSQFRFINYTIPTYEHSENQGSFAYSETYGGFFSWVNTNTVRFDKKFDRHGLNILAGIEALNTGKGRVIQGFGQAPFSYDPNYITLSTATTARQVESSLNLGVTFFSVFGRVNYSFADKYYLTGVIRRDGSSRFGAENRYGVFPAISAAWRITGEDFFQPNDVITDLKLRVGWGEMGNSNNVSPTNQYTLYAASLDASSYPITGSNTSAASGFAQSTIGNPFARWETSQTTNIGFDASFFNGRLEAYVDWWKKKTEDLLFQKPLPAVVGNATPPFVNIASMENTGLDFQFIARGLIGTGAWKYEASLVGSILKNEITAITDDLDYFDIDPPTNRLGSRLVRNQVGESISSFFGYEVVGLFQSAAEVAGAPTQAGAGVGRFRFADLNSKDDSGNTVLGVPDGIIDDADRTIIGSPVPDFTGGINFILNYRNFGVETYLYTSLGNEVFNMSKWYTDFFPSFTGANISERVKESWSTSNTGATLPIYENVSNFSTNTQPNSYYVEDGSYLRMQNLTFFYNFPADKIGSWARKLKVYVSANNIFTITGYEGLDPGVGGAADTLFGIDIGNYPVTRSFMIGVNAGF